MTAPQITPFPAAPSRLNDPQTFIERADPTIAHFQLFVPQVNAAIQYIAEQAAAAAAAAVTAVQRDATSGASATAASNSAAQAAASATAAAVARAAAELALDQFTDIYLGVKTADPATDNDGNALVPGAFYVNAVEGYLRVFTANGWVQSIATQIRVKRRAGGFVEVR